MQLKTLFFQHHSGTTDASSITSLSTLLSTLTNQLLDIIQHRVSVIEKIQLVQLYKEAVKLFLVHQSSFWLGLTFNGAVIVPGGAGDLC